MRTILFNGAYYPVVDILFPDGERAIATWSLCDVLFTEDNGYVSSEAQNIDEGIYFFVNENHIRLSNTELSLEVLRQMI